MAQLAVPAADITNQGYLDEAGVSTTIYSSIDEASPGDDNDYIYSATAPSSDVYVCQLSAVTDPVSSSDHIVRYRYLKSNVGGAQIDLTIQLRQSYASEGAPGTLVKQWSHTDISDEVTQVSQTLSGAEADSITNYADLFLRFVFNQA